VRVFILYVEVDFSFRQHLSISTNRGQISGHILSMKNTATDVHGVHSLMSSAGISTAAKNFVGNGTDHTLQFFFFK